MDGTPGRFRPGDGTRKKENGLRPRRRRHCAAMTPIRTSDARRSARTRMNNMGQHSCDAGCRENKSMSAGRNTVTVHDLLLGKGTRTGKRGRGRAQGTRRKMGRKGRSTARGRLQGRHEQMPPPQGRRTANNQRGCEQARMGKQETHDSSAGNDFPAAERRGGIVNAVTDWQGPDRHFLTTWKLLPRAKNARSPAYARFPQGRQDAFCAISLWTHACPGLRPLRAKGLPACGVAGSPFRSWAKRRKRAACRENVRKNFLSIH